MRTLRVAGLSLALCAGLLGYVRAAEGTDVLPTASALDVSESYHLLSTSFYRHVDNVAILAGGLEALGDAASRARTRVALPGIPGDATETQAVNQLDASIARVAKATHQTPAQVTYVAIAGMAGAVADRYTQFFTPDDFKKFNDFLDPEKISGIGVLVQPDQATGYIALTYVVPGTPADRAGLHQGDLVLSTDGVSTKGMSLDDASKVLRGKPGSVVHLVIQRNGSTGALPPVTVAIVRASVVPPTVIYHMMPDHVGYIAIFAFGRDTPDQFNVALKRVEDAGARALVLDLRNNGGGYVDSALEISSRFISNKTLVTVEDRGSHVTTVQADTAAVFGLPVAVLVNQYSASASEITAGALQDNGIATLVGTKTFGKGVMQTITPLADGSAIKITTAHYLTPANHDINLRGIEPDVRIDENHNAHFGEIPNDTQLRAALDVVEKKIALSTGKANKT
jgi:carboxyl-terminal processing protease